MEEKKKNFNEVNIFLLCADDIDSGKYDAWKDGWEDGTPRLTKNDKIRAPRLKALGNSVVPQCIEYIGNCILKYEEML
jgi:hypothetical protein